MTAEEKIYMKHYPENKFKKDLWFRCGVEIRAAIQEASNVNATRLAELETELSGIKTQRQHDMILAQDAVKKIAELEKINQELREGHKRAFVMGYNEAAIKYDSSCSFGELEAEQYYNQVFKTFNNEK